MRTSSQLTKVDQCEKRVRTNITQTSDVIIRAAAQKNVIKRILKGEPIPDIREEIDSILVSRNCLWENREQKLSNLGLYQSRIRRFIDWEQNREHIFPDDRFTTDDMVVDFFGEPVKAEPDYFVEQNNRVYVVKLTTSRFKSENEDINKNEAYVLGLCGEKLFPGKQVIVQYCHLGDKDTKTERAAMLRSYDDIKHQKISELRFDDAAKAFFAEQHVQEEHTECSEEDCAGCSMRNICHYEEPPISIDIAQEVRPISEIRLTHAQSEVIEYEQGIARVNAGPGAGKTLVVAMRIVELLKKGYEPEDICLLTFTKAGAEEMTARVVQYCAGNQIMVDPARLTSTTFNAFCQNLITAHYEELGYTMPPRVLPDETRAGIINRLIDQFPHIPEWNYTGSSSGQYAKFAKTALNVAKKMFAEIKKEGYTRDYNPYEGEYDPVSLDLIFQMYSAYDETLHQRNLLEYDDQILQVFKLLEIHPTLFDEIGYKHVIVDEFQDTDLPQIQLLQKVIDNASFKSFMVVGDDSQSIFAFRHTSPEYMINFNEYFGRFDDFALVENHRSPGEVIDFANKVNALNSQRVDKDLIATKPNGPGIIVSGFYSQKTEYEYIAEQIKRQIDAGVTPSDISFLACDKHELQSFASVLTKMGIPSVLMNPIPFASNSRVAALCSFYDSFTEGTTKGLLDYKNVMMHGALKGATAQELENFADEFKLELTDGPKSVERFLEYANALDENKTDECYQEFLEKISYCQNSDEMAEFFRDFKLYGEESCFKREGKYAGVALTTVHSAKGLEWDYTYLSLSHFDKPEYHRSISRFINSGEKDEVNRKWFVGVTRARKQLIMTGQFVVKYSQKECILNDYVKQAYDMLGRPYPYVSGVYWETMRLEKEEAIRESAEKLTLTGFRKIEASKATPDFPVVLRQRTGNEEISPSPVQRTMGIGGRPLTNYASPLIQQPRPQAQPQENEDLSAEDIEFA